MVGATLAERFRVERVAGRGGMSVVYRGADARTGAAVAVKVLTRSSDDAEARFEREGRILEGLDHPSIVRQLAHGTTAEGEPFLVLEWLEGEDLGRRLRRGPLGVGESIALARALADALSVAHALGVVHRDVKPSNVWLTDGDPSRPKLLDFGVARQLHGPTLTRTGLTIGTPRYMSPEQARGDRHTDGRADVFSLGCVLYECVTGRHAFEGGDMLAVLAKILLEEPAPMKEAPEWLERLVRGMLAKDAAARTPSMAAVAMALDRSGPPTLPPPQAPPALTDAERRVVSAILVPGAHAGDAGETLDSDVVLRQDRLRAAVSAFGATLETLADGGLVAVIESVGSARDQAGAAARVALALRDALTDRARGLGVATGRGLVRERLPVGEVLDRAAALGRAAPPRRVLVDALTSDLLDDAFEVVGDGERRELVGEAERVGTRRLLGRPTPFVGRDRELALVSSAWATCALERSARAVLVTGAPGAGKSRLRHELLARVGPEPEVWLGRGDPGRSGSPGHLVIDALRGAFAIARGQPTTAAYARVRARVARDVGEDDRERVAAMLAEALDAGPALDDVEPSVRAQLATARRDAVVLGDQVRRAFEDFALATAAGRPLLVVLEDLHWADPVTVRLIDGLLRLGEAAPVFVLALARPEVEDVFPALWSGRAVERITLGPLPRRAAERLARAVLGEGADEAAVARALDVAGGNAFFLEECLRAHAEGVAELPETVLAMVQGRLEAQGADARRVLRAASVFGGAFWTDGVRALVGDAVDVARVLAELDARELVTPRAESRFAGEEERTFRHAVLRDAAYASLTDADRRLGHELAGAWLAAHAETDAAVVAAHLVQGRDPAAAAPWHVKAASQALAVSDLEGTIAHAARAIGAGAAGELRGAALLASAEARRWRGEFQDGLRESLEAMALLPKGSAGHFHAAAEAAVQASRQGLAAEVEAMARALVDARAPEGADAEVAYLIALSRVAWQVQLATGKSPLCEEVLARFEALAPRSQDPGIAPRVALVRGYRARQVNDLLGALAADAHAARAFDAIGELRMGCNQRMNVGFAYLSLGKLEDAERELTGALATADRMGLHQISATVRHNLGLVYAYLGRTAEALAAETRAIDAFIAMGDVWFESFALVYRSLIHFLAGDGAAAEADARRALERASVAVQRTYAGAALALALALEGRAAEALEAARAAKEVGEVAGMDEITAVVHLARVRALEAAGDAGAQEARGEARRWLEGVVANLGDEEVKRAFRRLPIHARLLE